MSQSESGVRCGPCMGILFLCRVYLITCLKFSSIGQRGRHKKSITRGKLQCFQNLGYTVIKMAEHVKCSPQLVYKRLYEKGLHQRDKYTILSNEELETAVKDLHQNYANAGSVVKKE